MRYLLDTCTFYWFASGSGQISKKAVEALTDDECEIAVSIASFWEMAIKASLGKWPLGATLTNFQRIANMENITILPISVPAMEILKTLPFHHNDPFDRTIIASAIEEAWTVLTPDDVYDHYKTDGLIREW